MVRSRNPRALPLVLAVLAIVAGGQESHAGDWCPLWTTLALPNTGGSELAAAVIGSRVFFTGVNDGYSNVVDIYDVATDSWSTAYLSQPRQRVVATTVGDKVLFAGGQSSGGKSALVDIYDAATDTWSSASLTLARTNFAAASANGKAYFGGGEADVYTNVVDIYDAATNQWTTTTLSVGRQHVRATACGDLVFFAGGHGYNGVSSVVDIFDTRTNSRTTANLSANRYAMAATSAGGKAFFAGGDSYPAGRSDVVDIYDTATAQWSTARLSAPRYYLSATTSHDRVFFGPGYFEGTRVDVYDLTSGAWRTETLPFSRPHSATVAAGNKVFFAGGRDRRDVDVYTFQEYDSVTSSKPWWLWDRTTVAGRMHLAEGATLHLGLSDLIVGSMSGVAPINLAYQTLTVGGDDTDCAYSGALGGKGNLVKIGAGTLVLEAANTYQGRTDVLGGTLEIDGALSAASAVDVGGCATLAGNGTVGAVRLRSGGRIAPGPDGGKMIGSLTLLGNLTLEPGAQLSFNLNGPLDSDVLRLPGRVLSLAGLEFNDFLFSPSDAFGPGAYTLIDADAIQGDLGDQRSGFIGGLPASLILSGGDLVLEVVPEPSSAALLGTVVVPWLIWKRRHRQPRKGLPSSSPGGTVGH